MHAHLVLFLISHLGIGRQCEQGGREQHTARLGQTSRCDPYCPGLGNDEVFGC